MSIQGFQFEGDNTLYKYDYNALDNKLELDDTLEDGNKAANAEKVGDELATKANIDGYYEDLTSGTAEQLVSTQYLEDKVPYHFRTSGGSLDIGNREEDMLVGGSIVWNQLANRFENRSETLGVTIVADNTNGSITVTGTATATNYLYFRRNILVTANHVYCLRGSKGYGWLSLTGGSAAGRDSGIGILYKSNATSNVMQLIYGFKEGDVINETLYPQLFDLTTMFGSEVADAIYAMEQAEAGAGVAWFKKLFPKDYYEYNSGELMHVEGVSVHETVGKNLFDSPTIALSPYTGMTFNKAKFFKSGLTYTISVSNIVNATKWRLGFRLFDANGDVITYAITNGYVAASGLSDTYNNGTAILVGVDGTVASKTFTLLKDAYIAFCFSSGDVSSTTRVNYQVEIGNTATAYEPYVKHTYPLDDSLTLRGIPKIDVGGNLYYDGDTYESDGTMTRRYDIVDLGTLDWRYTESTELFWCILASVRTGITANESIPFICSKYVTANRVGSTSIEEKQIGTGTSGGRSSTTLIIKDTSYTDATAFKASLSGVMLVYELATPTTETAQPFQNPQIVDDRGTEEYVTTSLVPVGHYTKYPANLRDKIQHLPDLASDEGNYIINQQGQKMTLVRFRIPSAPSEDGTYILRATVSNGTPTYTWESEAVNEG